MKRFQVKMNYRRSAWIAGWIVDGRWHSVSAHGSKIENLDWVIELAKFGDETAEELREIEAVRRRVKNHFDVPIKNPLMVGHVNFKKCFQARPKDLQAV